MRAAGFLLRAFSLLFHLILCSFLLGITIVAWVSHQPLNLEMLPFPDDHLVRDAFLLALAGFVATVLAITRVFKYLFPIWAGVALYLLVRGFFFSSYTFSGFASLKMALWLLLAALIALIGALWILKPRRGRLYS